ncbi:alpha-amylase family glycosyl hydrolase [Candidatus Oscillochloris fontis]|uniref:alpha-amylase family glycosyl hydrolase n=1 Tax=Candidatus Oscillochloris fontis TaxID=2496868 RepID=UPI00101C5157|nr:alpha-amylase family glycosyl hydrolase [Candidatus Oscillochloris fontis]
MGADHVSSDFIFGTLATDARRLGAMQAELAGIAHRHRIEPIDPIPDQPVRLWVSLGPHIPGDRVTCYFTTDGGEPVGARGVAGDGSQMVAFVRQAVRWETFLWGYLEEWVADIPPQPAGTTVRYRIEAWSSLEDGSSWASEIIGSTPGDGTVLGDESPGDIYLHAMGVEFGLTFVRRARTFAFRVDHEQTPDWLYDGLIYQVFVDRYAPGGGRAFTQPDDLNGFYGGTLAGVIEQIDQIAALGVTLIWLSPIFSSPSHHGYDTTDFYAVEPRLGTLTDLRELLDAAHVRGIRVLLDFTANHVSDQHPAFQAACRDPHSPTYGWFTFTEYPETYISFFGVRSLPQIDTDHPDARQALIDAAAFWLRQGVDGFRLDYNIGPSHAFWVDFRAAMRNIQPEVVLIGEAVETADLLRTYSGRLDGCLDFLLLQALRLFFGFHEIRASQFDSFVCRHLSAFPPGFVLPSFLDNHDMNRFLWIVGGDRRRLKLAALCQYTLPHPPILYYGTEVGLSQRDDVRHADGSGHPEEARLPMLWGAEQDQDLLTFYRRLGTVRRATAALWRGVRQTVYLDDVAGHYAYQCRDGDEIGLVVLNNGPQVGRVPLPAAEWTLAVVSDSVTIEGGAAWLPAYGGVIFTARLPQD